MYAGITSSFVRSEFPSVDIPPNHPAFAVPKGHNAPQQVSYYIEITVLEYINNESLIHQDPMLHHSNFIF